MSKKTLTLTDFFFDKWSRRFLFAALALVNFVFMFGIFTDGVVMVTTDSNSWGWIKIVSGIVGLFGSLLFAIIAKTLKEPWLLDKNTQ